MSGTQPIYVQSLIYNSDGFLVQLSEETTGLTILPMTISLSFPEPRDGVLYDAVTSSLIVPPGITFFSFVLDREASLVGSTVDITIDNVSISQVLSNTYDSTDTTVSTDYTAYFESMANSLSEMASTMNSIDQQQRTMTTLATTSGIRTRGAYDSFNQIAIYKLLVESAGAKDVPTLWINEIASNVCYTSVAHSLSINDIIIPKETVSNLTEGTVYYVKSIPSSKSFTLGLSSATDTVVELIDNSSAIVECIVQRTNVDAIIDYISKIEQLSDYN